jgi:hypothetical protein
MEKVSSSDEKHQQDFADYASFIAKSASTALYDLKVEEFLTLLKLEAQKWDLLASGIKDAYAAHVRDVKATRLYWIRLFTHPPDLKDKIFVFKCKRWIVSYSEINQIEEEGVEVLKDIWALSNWHK